MFIRNGERLGSVLVDKASTGPPPQPELEPATQLTGTEQEADRQAAEARLLRPPTSGPGSGVDAWRRYAAEVTNSPVESWAGLSRDEIIFNLDLDPEGTEGDGA